MRKKRLQQISL